MPVSLERLIAEVEPAVITAELTRDCIQARELLQPELQASLLGWVMLMVHGMQVSGPDADIAEEKKRTIPYREVECLVFSFKNLACIANLKGFNSLTKLQLDNNHLNKIENISHLVCSVLAAIRVSCSTQQYTYRTPKIHSSNGGLSHTHSNAGAFAMHAAQNLKCLLPR
jgi:hypothetical protein